MSSHAAQAADHTRRNVLLLALCQGLSNSGMSMLVAVAALSGHLLASDKSLATLPLALQWTATMATTVPASLIMRRLGRRTGLSIGAGIFAVGGLIGASALRISSFELFCLACMCIGAGNAFAQYYRFAAADAAPESFRSKAISLVLAGGVIAGVVGPELAKHTIDWFLPTLYAGCYVTLTIIAGAIFVILQGVRIPRLTAAQLRDSGRPLAQIVRQPAFFVAVLAGALGYGSMTMVMTATPLAMKGCGFAFSDTATVIQGHVIAMFLPSFFTGSLIQRFGNLRIIAIGSLLTAGCLVANMSAVAFGNFSIGLALLGLGWNFMFIGGSTLLTRAYTTAERAKTQAANDFVVFSSSVIGAFSSGLLQNNFGWVAVNAGIAPAMLIALAAVAWLALHERKPQPTAD
jgi:predicted MFS family arabinose efflux permease